MPEHEYQTVRIWTETHKRLRKIAAETGESMVEVLERLAAKEQKRLFPAVQVRPEVLKEWEEGQLFGILRDMYAKHMEVTSASFSAYFEQQTGFSLSPEEAKSWLEADA